MKKQHFKDFFSGHANDYNQYRPHYPRELFAYLASLSPVHQTAWDCATGNGQSAVMLAEHFAKVIATDASEMQIAQAIQRAGVHYHVATAENSLIDSHSIDLVSVAQAFHWFNQDAFIMEGNRVLKPAGVIAIWTYNLLSINPALDKIIAHLYESILGNYWDSARTMVENSYADVNLPFKQINEIPTFTIRNEWQLAQLVGYLKTWSAVKKYEQEHGENPVDEIYDSLLAAWGNNEDTLVVEWPLSLKIWRK